MENTKRLWMLLGSVIFITMFILGWFGKELYRKVPPIPLQVQTTQGLFSIISVSAAALSSGTKAMNISTLGDSGR